jgi:predicted XRE-type DNA-binding protein
VSLFVGAKLAGEDDLKDAFAGKPGSYRSGRKTTQKDQIMIEIEESSGNVYEDLSTPNANEMRVKSQLAAKIGEIIKARHLTQVQASEILGLSQPKLSEMLRGKFRGISEAKMMECLSLLGRDVQIVVKSAPRSRKEGRIEVVFT